MKYTAITIGPILKTLKSVKSTKAIWTVSYMFSYLMKNIIKKADLKQENVLLPYFEENDLKEKFGVGLFPDRLFIKKEMPNLQDVIDKVLKEFSDKIKTDLEESHAYKEIDLAKITDFIKEYFTFHPIEIDVASNENTIFKINDLLDTAELGQKVTSSYDKDYLIDFLENTFYNFLVTQEFDPKEKRFPSTIEIAMAAFKDTDKNTFNRAVTELFKKEKGEDKADNQQRFINRVYQNYIFNVRKRNYQKYVAVVQADGDNIGSFIKQLYSEKDKDKLIKRFSNHLLQFGKKSVALIKKYQGTPIYAGGDDLLYFCPVAHTGYAENNTNERLVITQTFLTLINEIDDVFIGLFNNDKEFKPIIDKASKKPSMSYGVSISYYKFPLNEALEQGANQLFGVAKKTKDKNAVSYSVLKHSGQHFGTLYHKHQASFNTYQELLKQHISDDNYLHGIVYKLEPQQSIFYSIGNIVNEVERNENFDNFFFNTFDESVHRKRGSDDKLIPFLETLKQLFKDVYSENKLSEGVTDDKKHKINTTNLNKIYASLRFVGFLHNKEER